jgi:hypothetical protein
MRLKNDGILFFSVPEKRGLSKFVNLSNKSFDDSYSIDNFTIEYILKNAGFELIDKGVCEKYDADSGLPGGNSQKLDNPFCPDLGGTV